MIRRRRLAVPATVVFLVLAAAAAAAAGPVPETPASGPRLGLRVGYSSQRVSWDAEGAPDSSLDSGLAAAELEFPIGRGSSISILAGYDTADIGGLIFRSLPFSIDYQAGAGGGAALGGAFVLALTSGPALRLRLQGEITAHLGSSRKRDLPGLAVDGSLEAKATWLRARVGPLVAFGSGSGVTPYVFPFFHYFQGGFELRETVQSLKGEQKIDFKGRSQFGIAGGLDLPLTPGIRLRAEAGAYPGSGGTGYSATLATLFAF